ncbi:MAG: hypothetical protein DMD29_05945 [Gemmatimonadetes bacterium]|nr:MAG: hypothetical protein DMD29_05945 [Gemmatimonadota bacterium]
MPVEILHLAFASFPADPRVRREVAALRDTGRGVAVVALRETNQRAVQRRDGVVIIRVPGHKSRGGFLSYLTEYAAFVWRCRRLVARHRTLARVRVVHVHTLPDFLLWAALPAQRRGAKLVFDMHEIFPEFVAAKFPGPLGALASWLARRIERWARRQADLTITVNHPIDELLAARPVTSTKPERRLVLHNTADPADFGDTSAPSRANAVPLQLIYHGTLAAFYGLDVAIRALARARSAGLDARLTILGDGPERPGLQRLAADLSLDTVAFETPIPQPALPARLARCAAGVVPTLLDGMTRYSLSNKALDYVHLGIPLLAARLPSYLRYFGEDMLWYFTPGDPDDLARAIRDLAAAAAAERARRAQLARQAIAPYDWARERERLLAAYAELLGNRSARIPAMRSAAVPSP